MTAISAYLVFVVLLLSQSPVNQTNQVIPVRIGFSCCHFYDPTSGTPVFMPEEEMWLFAEQNITVELNDPNHQVTAAIMLANASMKLYRFRSGDASGLWRLEVHTTQGAVELPIFLVRSDANAVLGSLDFGFAGTELTIDGALIVNGPLEGGTLLLVREENITTLETDQAPIPGGFLHANITWNEPDPFTLDIEPYTSNPIGLNRTSVWVELSSEVALVKLVGTSRVVTLVPQVFARSNHQSMNVRPNLQQQVKLILPRVHQVGPLGDAPLRIGPIHVTVYVQTQNVIYTLRTDTFLLGDGLVSSVASSVSIPPLSNTVTFYMKDDLQRLSYYNLYLLAKESGLIVSWNRTITPPVTRVHVVNTLDSTPIQDYQLESNQFQAVAKVGSETLVIPQDPNAMAGLNLSVGGFVLPPNEFSPSSAKLQPMSSLEISTGVVDAQLQVRDVLGNAATLGTMKLTRVLLQVQSETVVRSWNASNGVLSLELPPGQYGVELTVDGSTATTQFSVSHQSENVTLTLPPLMLSESRSQLIVAAAVLVLIMIEAVFAFRLWRKLARTRKKKVERQSPLSP